MKIVRDLSLQLISFYQKFLTHFAYGSCRYYPTCSEYSRQQFKHNRIDLAFFNSTKRILSCNQLFPGGIDYPVIIKKMWITVPVRDLSNRKIENWFVPVIGKTDHYYIIKDISKTELKGL